MANGGVLISPAVHELARDGVISYNQIFDEVRACEGYPYFSVLTGIGGQKVTIDRLKRHHGRVVVRLDHETVFP